MEHKLQKTWVILLTVLVIAGIVGGVAYSYSSREILGKIAGTTISSNEFIFVLKQVINRSEKMMLPNGATEEERKTLWNSEVEGKKFSEKMEEIALEEVKKYKIQLIKADKANIELTKEEKDKNRKEIDQMIEKLGGRVSANDRILTVYGIPTSEYRKIREKISLISKYMEFEKSKLKASDEEILDYYNKNYENDEKVTVRHILLSTKDSSNKDLPADKIEEQRIKADEVLEKIKNGEDIEKLVKEYSDDMVSVNTKGQYTFEKGNMVPEFEGWAFNNAPGNYGIVKTEYGFHVIVKPTFEELKDEVKDLVLNTKYEELLKEWAELPEYEIVVNQKALKHVRNII